jgi:hypothetical protein
MFNRLILPEINSKLKQAKGPIWKDGGGGNSRI